MITHSNLGEALLRKYPRPPSKLKGKARKRLDERILWETIPLPKEPKEPVKLKKRRLPNRWK